MSFSPTLAFPMKNTMNVFVVIVSDTEDCERDKSSRERSSERRETTEGCCHRVLPYVDNDGHARVLSNRESWPRVRPQVPCQSMSALILSTTRLMF